MFKISRLRLFLVGCALATPVVVNSALLLAVPCNGTVPENPAPLCGPVVGKCDSYTVHACPAQSSCTGVVGHDRAVQPKACDAGAATNHCDWSPTVGLCYGKYKCKWVSNACVNDGLCAVVQDDYRVSMVCDPPGGG